MLRCTCPALSAARASIIAALTQIAADALRPAAPNFGNDAALMVVLQLATSIGPHHARVDAAPAAAPPPQSPAPSVRPLSLSIRRFRNYLASVFCLTFFRDFEITNFDLSSFLCL
jgi:hypothetical protein